MKIIKIATATSRFAKKWKNTELTWDELCQHLANTTRKTTTHAHYLKLSKSEQDRLKDIGGFVGGQLKGGLRRSDHVLTRSLITLDADYADLDQADNFELVHEYEVVIYSTIKHSSDTPRLRYILPLTREVSPDEYEAIARMLAKQFDIEQFDDSTYQASRLMYWPSTTADVDYYYKHCQGRWVDPDALLAKYQDWRDVSQWPLSSRELAVRQKRPGKQEDPTTKQGLVGAFCRTYSITEAIETFLAEIYEPTAHGDRYTYKNGSTYAGVVVYGDLWAYSNHATDPASGQLCNAFDLVRVHKFGRLDVETKDGTPVNKLPSYQAMVDFVRSDDQVKLRLIKDRVTTAAQDFEGLEVEEKDWRKELSYDRKGNIEQTLENVELILFNDPELKHLPRHNDFTGDNEITGALPWRSYEEYRLWRDADTSNLYIYLEKKYNYTSFNRVDHALNAYMSAHHFNPVKDMLEGLQWDGQERLDTLLIDYLGAEDNDYVRAVTRKTFTAAIARIYQPGCKFDYMLTLTGPQGIGKSTLVRKLSKGLYNDGISWIGNKESMELLQGVWMVEMAELTAAKKQEVEAVKQFISKQIDTYRPAYGRFRISFPRQCIFIGTTNEVEFLKDTTGNRRYWVVGTSKSASKSVFDDLDEDTIDQLLAEAKYRYEQGEALYLERALEDQARVVQEMYTQSDPWAEAVIEYLDTPLPDDYYTLSADARRAYFLQDEFSPGINSAGPLRTKVTAVQIWQELIGPKSNSLPEKHESKRINDILRRLPDWEEKNTMRVEGNLRTRGFTKTKCQQ